jgi:hypothetical protein
MNDFHPSSGVVQSAVVGDYYRDLSLNYHDCQEHGRPYPARPDNIPHWVTSDDLEIPE